MKTAKKRLLILSTILSSSVGFVSVACTSIAPIKKEETPPINPGDKDTKPGDSGSKGNITPVNPQLEELNAAAKKVTFSVPNSSNILASLVNKTLVEVGSLDKTKYKVNISSIQENNDKESVILLYNVQSVLGTDKSDPMVFVINGFKKINNPIIPPIIPIIPPTPAPTPSPSTPSIGRLPISKSDLNAIANTIKFDYISKSTTFPKDAVTSQIATTVLSNPNVEVLVSSVSPDSFNSIRVNFFVIDRQFRSSVSDVSSSVISGFRSEPLTTQQLNDENAKLTLSYLNVSETSPNDFNNNSVIANNIDLNKVTFIIQGVSVNKDLTSVTVNYLLVDKSNPTNVLENQSKIISGFKFPTLNQNQFDEIAKNIVFDYTNKATTSAADANSAAITVTNPDSNTDVTITSLTPDVVNKREVLVSYKLIDKRNPENFVEKNVKLDGFKPIPTTVQTLNNFADFVTFDYPQKAVILASDVDDSKIISKSPLENLSKVHIMSVAKDNATRSITITYTLNDKNSDNKSIVKTKVLSGFKPSVLVTQQLIDEAKKVTFSYANKEQTLVSEINLALIKSSGNDTSKTRVTDISFKPTADGSGILISYIIKDLSNENIYFPSEFELKGFKKQTFSAQQLDDLAKKVTVSYPQKSETLFSNVSNDNITFGSYPKEITTPEIVRITKNDANQSITVVYTLNDVNSTNKSSPQSVTISDFKKTPLTVQQIIEYKNKISFSYDNKAAIEVFLAQQSLIKIEGNDSSKTKVEIKSIKRVAENGSIEISFRISDVNYPDIFLDSVFILKGFKRTALSTDILNKIAKSITLDYANKREQFATGANKAGIIKPELSNDSVEIEINRIITDTGNNTIRITYQIKDKLYPTHLSDIQSATISGFKTGQLSEQDFKNANNAITFGYPGKESVIANTLNLDNLQITNPSDDKVNVVILNYTVNPDKTSVKINYLLVDKSSSSNVLKNLSKDINGFKRAKLTQEELSEINKGLIFTYPSKNTTVAASANASTVSINNPNTSTTVNVTSVNVNSENNQSLDVHYTLSDNAYSDAFLTGVVKLDGFKHPATSETVLNNLANSLTLSYPNKSQTFASEIANGSISFGDYSRNLVTPEIKSVSVNLDKTSINVQYVLKDVFSDNVSSNITKTISDFKTPPLTEEQLNTESNGISFTYNNKEQVQTAAVKKASIIGVGNNNSKTEIQVQSFIPNDSGTAITVYYKLIDRNFASNFIIRTYVLSGFKAPELTPNFLNDLANSITLNYPNKNETLVTNIQNSSIQFVGDLSKVNATVVSVTPATDSKTEATIVYKLTDKSNSSNSIIVSRVLSGFKDVIKPVVVTDFTKEQLDQQLENAVLTVNHIETKTVDQVTNSDYKLLGVDTTRLEVLIKSTEVASRTSITVKFVIKQIGKSIESDQKTQILTGFKPSLPTAKPFTRPSEVFPTAQPIFNKTFDVSIGSSKSVFNYMSEGTNSYRIPNSIKLSNGDILVSADKRFYSAADSGGPIEQVIKRSKDNGKTWSKDNLVIKISGPRVNNGLVIDGSLSEVWVDRNDHSKGKKLIYWADFFPYYFGIHNLQSGAPYKKVGSTVLWKAFVREGSNRSSDYVFRKSAVRPGWWRLWKLPAGKNVDSLNESDISRLVAQNTYLNMTYDPQNRSVSGQIFENVTNENDLWNPTLMSTRSTIYSIFDDPNASSSKYSVLGTDYNGVLESYDNGLTWTNFQFTDEHWRYNDTVPFIGAGVGNGIQLNHQKDKSRNGRIIFPVYSYQGGNQRTFYIYSDDNGQSWHEMKFSGFQNIDTSESSMTETNDGDIYWLFRGPNSRSKISVSKDGGITWKSPVPGDSSAAHQINSPNWDGDVFIGLSHFTIKGQTYFVFTAPEVRRRQDGVLFITKDWQHFDRVWGFDTNHKEHFQYSYVTTVEEGANYADIIVAYEWNRDISILGLPQLKKPDGRTNRPVGSAITVDKFRIILK